MRNTGSDRRGSAPISRRALLATSTAAAAGAFLGGSRGASAQGREPAASALAVIPMPAPVPAKDAYLDLPDTRLWYWDTGGDGRPVVFLHPATGSGLIWGYQQPVFAKAGYRAIGYSRRGYYNSTPLSRDKGGVGSADLHALVEHLGLRRFHVVASAAGGSVASDYAFSHPDRLFSVTVSSNQFGVRDGEIAKAAASIRPKGFDEMPAEFRELGPSYRAANPEGTKLWMELEHKALIGAPVRQTLTNQITQERLKSLKVPTQVISGAADLATPPAIARLIQAAIPGSELVVAPESGHSVYWERPDVFNGAILDFIGRHGT